MTHPTHTLTESELFTIQVDAHRAMETAFPGLAAGDDLPLCDGIARAVLVHGAVYLVDCRDGRFRFGGESWDEADDIAAEIAVAVAEETAPAGLPEDDYYQPTDGDYADVLGLETLGVHCSPYYVSGASPAGV
jgi:hypothetical protein